MTYNHAKHHRHSIRLKGHAYSQAGAYFVTIATHNRECLFSEIVDGELRMNECGAAVRQRNYYEHIVRDEKDMTRIRNYIANNPANWKTDEDNPKNIKVL